MVSGRKWFGLSGLTSLPPGPRRGRRRFTFIHPDGVVPKLLDQPKIGVYKIIEVSHSAAFAACVWFVYPFKTGIQHNTPDSLLLQILHNVLLHRQCVGKTGHHLVIRGGAVPVGEEIEQKVAGEYPVMLLISDVNCLPARNVILHEADGLSLIGLNTYAAGPAVWRRTSGKGIDRFGRRPFLQRRDNVHGCEYRDYKSGRRFGKQRPPPDLIAGQHLDRQDKRGNRHWDQMNRIVPASGLGEEQQGEDRQNNRSVKPYFTPLRLPVSPPGKSSLNEHPKCQDGRTKETDPPARNCAQVR